MTGTFIAMACLALGADPTYAGLEMVAFAGAGALLGAARSWDPLTAGIPLVSLAKVFFVSQVVSLLLGRAPDSALSKPIVLELAVIVAAWSVFFVTAAMRFVRPFRSLAIVRDFPQDPTGLNRVGLVAAIVGLTSQAIWSTLFGSISTSQAMNTGALAAGSSIFAFLAPVSLLSLASFAAARLIESRGRTVISSRLIIVLLLFILETFPLASKTSALQPLLAVALVAVSYRWRAAVAPVAGGLLVAIVVALVLYPLVNVARLTAFRMNEPVPVAFVTEGLKALGDPSEFARIQSSSDVYERAIGQGFYGRTMGFLDRFTPLTTDRVLDQASRSSSSGARVYLDAATALLPQTFGFARDRLGRQREIEQILRRSAMENGKVGWDNTGFLADGYLAHGLVGVAIMYALFAIAVAFLSRVTFSGRPLTVLWVPFLVRFMFMPADLNFVAAAPNLIWNWLFLALGCSLVAFLSRRHPLQYLRAEVSKSR